MKVLIDLDTLRVLDYDDGMLRLEGDDRAACDLSREQVTKLAAVLGEWLGSDPFLKFMKLLKLQEDVVDDTAKQIAAWIEDNPPGDGMRAGDLLAEDIREGTWK